MLDLQVVSLRFPYSKETQLLIDPHIIESVESNVTKRSLNVSAAPKPAENVTAIPTSRCLENPRPLLLLRSETLRSLSFPNPHLVEVSHEALKPVVMIVSRGAPP